MTDQLPPCPECASEFAYEQGALLVCPMCGHEWSPAEDAEAAAEGGAVAATINDAFGTPLADGDSVTVVKDLKVKGAGGVVKVGTKVRGIRLVENPVDGHDIEAKVPGFGSMHLKSSVVKKA